jgi:S-layer homology domain
VQPPGCALFTLTQEILPEVVDNVHHVYALFLAFSGSYETANKAGRFRILYRLQVSEAPAIATFSDVPTNHPFFRYIEALAASGITGGCGTGIYCPQAPVTRGQMAAFLSIALGLHFPN